VSAAAIATAFGLGFVRASSALRYCGPQRYSQHTHRAAPEYLSSHRFRHQLQALGGMTPNTRLISLRPSTGDFPRNRGSMEDRHG